jgi:ubiquinone/menaquinone biosynthesis C-methylase UbiE
MNVSFDRVADIYDKTRYYSSNAMKKVLETLKREFANSKRILDVGVGTGRFSQPLQSMGIEVVGIDISKSMLEKALEKGTKDIIVTDACALPFRDSSFDEVLSVHALHLIKEWDTALKEISRVTKNHLISIGWENSEGEISPGVAYQDSLKKHGYNQTYPGLAEPKLKKFLKPVKYEFITRDIGNVEKSLGHLSDRVYHMQWNIPDELHERIMKELKREFRGKVEYSNDLYLYKWDITEIKEYLDGEMER